MITLLDWRLAALACLTVSCARDSGSSDSHDHPSVTDIAGGYIRQQEFKGRIDSLMLVRDGRFVRKVSSPDGNASYEGRIEWRDDVLHLPRPQELDDTGLFDLEAEGNYRVVEWGDRVYLIEAVDLLRFCNAVNTGSEPRSEAEGRFYLRARDWEGPVSGLPKVPASWRGMLLTSRLEGYVEESAGNGRAWIGLGTEDGLKAAMLLNVHDVPVKPSVIKQFGGPTECDMHLELVTIEPHRSLVQLCETWFGAGIAPGLRITAGATPR